jgi:hypothetical protein
MNTLKGAPSPQGFARAFAKEFGAAVKDAAGRDGRLSANEAKSIAEPFRDNALNYLEKTGQKSVSVNKLIGAAERYAFIHADKASGGDGRVSLKDGEKLSGDLRADFFALRGRALPGDEPTLTADQRRAGFERFYDPWNEDTEEGMMDYSFPASMLLTHIDGGGSEDISKVPPGSDLDKDVRKMIADREDVVSYDTEQLLQNPDDGSFALYYSQDGETFQMLTVYDDAGARLGVQRHFDDGSEDWYPEGS